MKTDILLNAIDGIDGDLIDACIETGEAFQAQKLRKRRLRRNWGVMAACLCAMIACGAATLLAGGQPGIPTENIVSLPADCKTSALVSGTAAKYTGSLPSFSGAAAPPAFRFCFGNIAVVAKAVEALPDVYETLNDYGSIYTYRYRIFKMQVIDPLESNMDGEFYYALPAHLMGELTKYDALLIGMRQKGYDYILKNTASGELTAFPLLFDDPHNHPELGSMIAFTGDVFDESLWQDRSWLYGYQFARHYLEEASGNDEMLVYRGATLADALQKREAIQAQWGKSPAVREYAFQTDEATAAQAFIEPFANGVFVQLQNNHDLTYRRYIGGCPTNEWISIDPETEQVTRSEYRFQDGDFAALPDIGAYIEALALPELKPQHTDPAGKELLFCSAAGWYEKTEAGVYAVVRIAWSYAAEGDYFRQYYDETFLLLEGDRSKAVSREDLIRLIGDNSNISYGEYGKETEIPLP